MKQFLFILLTVFSFSMFSQYRDYFNRFDVYGGLTYLSSRTSFYGIKYAKTSSSPAIYDTIGGRKGTYVGAFAGVGLNLPIARFNKDMSIGIHIAGNFGYVDGIALNFPIGLQYKFGTDATLDCEKNFGFSIGGGYNIFMTTGDLGEGIFKYPYLSPEISYNSSLGLFKLKSYIQFTEQTYHFKLDTETHYTFMKAPLMICLAICPNFQD